MKKKSPLTCSLSTVSLFSILVSTVFSWAASFVLLVTCISMSMCGETTMPFIFIIDFYEGNVKQKQSTRKSSCMNARSTPPAA